MTGAALILLVAALAAAQPTAPPEDEPTIVAALTREVVEIRSDFTGADLILYGAARGLREDDDIIVVVRGPLSDLRVMRKQRRFGIWVNSAPVRFEDVPDYYAVAATRPLREVGTFTALRRSGIGLDNLRLSAPDTERIETRFGAEVVVSEIGEEIAEYRGAIARTRLREGVFAETPGGVEVLEGGLFRALVKLPAATPVGVYTVEVYLFRGGAPAAARSTALTVRKAGLEQAIYEWAHQRPRLYGLAAVIMALLAGWGAAAVFGRR
ncbi:MAG: TIGR02186 family protein [Maricaulaceae bacterium]|nr:TIGR02186 family protein [Maricaulaceae bacterium]